MFTRIKNDKRVIEKKKQAVIEHKLFVSYRT